MTKRRDIIKALKAAGFRHEGGTGHDVWVHPDGRRTLVGRHAEIPSGTAWAIAKQARIDLLEQGARPCRRDPPRRPSSTPS